MNIEQEWTDLPILIWSWNFERISKGIETDISSEREIGMV